MLAQQRRKKSSHVLSWKSCKRARSVNAELKAQLQELCSCEARDLEPDVQAGLGGRAVDTSIVYASIRTT